MPRRFPVTLRDLFPRLSQFPSQGLPWSRPLQSLDDVGTAAVAATATAENHHGMRGTDHLLAVAVAARDDVLALRASGSLPSTFVDFLQLWVSLHPARHGIVTGRLALTHDWLLAALDDQPVGTPDVVVELRRLPEIIAAPLPGAAALNAQAAVLGWLADLYYCVRNQGALRFLAMDSLAFAEDFVRRCPPSSEAIEAAAHIAAWARAANEAVGRRCAVALYDWYRSNLLSPAQRKDIAVLFSTDVGTLTRRAPAQWAALTLKRHSNELLGHERLQVLTSLLAGETVDTVRERWPEVRGALEEHRRMFTGQVEDSYGAGRLFRVSARLLSVLLPAGAVDLVMDLLAELRRVDGGATRRRGPDLVLVPNHEQGTLYATVGASTLPGSRGSISDVIRATNESLGLAINVEDDPAFVLEHPNRMGVPALETGLHFEKVLMARLGLAQVRTALRTAPFDGCKGMADISGLPIPWQSLMVRAVGRTWPIIRSFEEPKQDRAIARVLYWSAGTGGTFTSATKERSWRRRSATSCRS